MAAATTFQQQMAAVALAPGQFLQSANAKANGLMKRNSLFSRTESRGRVTSTRTRNDSIVESQLEMPRSQSAFSIHSADSGKRHSLFGSRKRSAKKEMQLRESVVECDAEDTETWSPSRDRIHLEHESAQNLRKQTISPPYNFQHVNHTQKRHVPDLSTVDERDLSKEFWAAAAYQKPQGHLNGIQAEDLVQKLESMGVPRGSMSSSRPTTPVLSEHLAHRQCRPLSPLAYRDHNATDAAHFPRPNSSLGTSGFPSPPQSPRKQSPVLPIASQFIGAKPEYPSICTTLRTTTSIPDPSQVQYRAKQPLPALPTHTKSVRSSRSSLHISSDNAHVSREYLPRKNSIPPSPRSRKSFGSIHRNPSGVWSTPDIRLSGGLAEIAWEEDVDFSYEHEAEATCDFDWDAAEVTARNGSLVNGSDVPESHVDTWDGSLGPVESLDRSTSRLEHSGCMQARQSTGADSHISVPCLSTKPSPLLPIAEYMPKTARAGSRSGNYTSSDSESMLNSSSFDSSIGSHSSCDSIMAKRTSGIPKDARHTSVASLDSVPELVHSRKTAQNASTPDLPQTSFEEFPSPPTTTVVPAGTVVIMRRPSKMSNRAILQAGRAVQNRRPATPSRFSRLLQQSATAEAREEEGEEETTWI